MRQRQPENFLPNPQTGHRRVFEICLSCEPSMKRNILCSFLLVFLLAACSGNEKERRLLEEMTQEDPVQEAYNVEFIFSEMAVIQARLEAPHVVEINENNKEVQYFDRGLHLTFYNEEGQVKSELTANSGKFRDGFSNAEVRGNVVMINENNGRMETEKLLWNQEQDSLYTDEFVKIRDEDQIIYGEGMVANTDFTYYEFYKIRGVVLLDEEEE